MKQYIISEQLLDSFMQYLATRPLGEVLDGYNALKNLPQYTEVKEEDTSTVTHVKKPKIA